MDIYLLCLQANKYRRTQNHTLAHKRTLIMKMQGWRTFEDETNTPLLTNALKINGWNHTISNIIKYMITLSSDW